MDNKYLNEDGTPNFDALNAMIARRRAAEAQRQTDAILASEIADIEHEGMTKYYVITKMLFADGEYDGKPVHVERYSRRSFETAMEAVCAEVRDVFPDAEPESHEYYLGDLTDEGTDDEAAHSHWSWSNDHSRSWDKRIPVMRLGCERLGVFAEYYLAECYR